MIDSDHCDEFNWFCIDYTLDNGCDILETISDAIAGGSSAVTINVKRQHTYHPSSMVVGGIYSGVFAVGCREYHFNIESSNMRGDVMLEWCMFDV